VALVTRRITIAVLAAFLVGAVLAVPASSSSGPQAAAAKKAQKKCKKGKKGKKKAKRCKRGSGGTSGVGLPGQATPATPKQPNPPGTPPTLHVASVSATPNPVFAGNSTTGLVTVDAPAPSGGQQVDLQSSDSSVDVPASVIVAPTQTTATFQVNTTEAVAATSTLTASIGGSNATTQLNVVDEASVSSVQLERQCFTPFRPFSSNRVSLDVPAPEDTLVGITSDSAALEVPAGVTVPDGSTSAFFSVNAVSDAPSVTVTATLGTSQASDTASVSATDPPSHVDDLTLEPDAVVAGNGSQGTVTLECEAPADTTVTLAADSGIGLPPGNVVTVPAGELSATFNITTEGDLTDGQYDISATVGADTPVQATLTIDSSLPT
jgi:hypothetical protein